VAIWFCQGGAAQSLRLTNVEAEDDAGIITRGSADTRLWNSTLAIKNNAENGACTFVSALFPQTAYIAQIRLIRRNAYRDLQWIRALT
jgi:hypothetical protein